MARERRFEELAERVEYAVIIQRRVRGWRCKRAYTIFKRMQRATYRNRAAAKVQARVRGILTRARTREKFRDIIERKAAIKIQSLARKRRGHHHLLALREARKRNLAALKIQSGARSLFAKRQVCLIYIHLMGLLHTHIHTIYIYNRYEKSYESKQRTKRQYAYKVLQEHVEIKIL
jgi:hypothetical protein